MLTLVAMSGGVDSSVAAALVADEVGPDAALGATLRLEPDPPPAASARCAVPAVGRSCCAPDDLQDARRAAARLGLRYYILDARADFEAQVISPFVAAYARGETPNPCVQCNERLKFGWLLASAARLGADCVATGHYARVERKPDGRWALLRGRDAEKDQSYFLHGLGQAELARIRFPLGGLEKAEVRRLARERGLPTADKRESMEVCFVPDGDVGGFLEARGVAPARGEIVDPAGRVLGEHGGVHRFTVGQRRGLGLSTRGTTALPLYVAALDAGQQRVVVAPREEAVRASFSVPAPRWSEGPPRDELTCTVQIRHRGRPLPARVQPAGSGVRVELRAPALGVSPGQSAVFYDGNEVLGGGAIA
jgi:tRNA-specific 2-thiouridylase